MHDPIQRAAHWTLAALLLTAVTARAGDWPQILGPHRDGQAAGEKLLDKFPSSGPKVVWEKSIGEGYAGVAVAGGKAVLFHRLGGSEVLEALDAASGKPLWKVSYPTDYQSGIAPDNGPRCVPVIHDGKVFAFGASGDLHAVALADGAKVWSRDVFNDYEAPEGYFGAGSTPIVAGGKLLVNVGAKGAGLVAFDPASGKTLWKGTDEAGSYSSPVEAMVDGVKHVVFITRLNLLGIDPASGKVLYEMPFGQRGPTVNGANPLVIDGHVFATASYGIGALWAQLGKNSIKTVWENDDTMSSQYPTPVLHEGYLYGIHGRQDVGTAALRCIDPKTHKVAWNQNGFGMGTLINASGKLVIMKTDGTLVLAAASPKAFQQLGSAQVLPTISRALPALANGLLYVRDTKTLKCLDLRAK